MHKRTIRCMNCYRDGHNKRSCPDATQEQKDYYANAGARKCSWCSMPGHNKSSCSKRKDDMAEYIVQNKDYRRNILNVMVQHGIGVGSLLREYRAAAENCPLFIVTDILWDAIQFRKQTRRVFVTEYVGQERTYGYTFTMPHNDYVNDYNNWYTPVVLTRRPESEILSLVPPNWLDGTSEIEEFFK